MNITWEMVAAFLTVIGAIGGIWKYLEGKIKAAKDEANLTALAAEAKSQIVADNLAAYKLHVAETYASKDGVNLQFAAITKSITDVGERMEKRLDGMNERLDRVIEAGQKPQRARTS